MSGTDGASGEAGPSGRRELALGALIALALHAGFTGATALLASMELAEGQDLLGLWLRNLGFLQGIYMLPALITAGLAMRPRLAMGMGAIAAVTLLGSLVVLVA